MPDPAIVVAMREFKAGILAREAAQMQTMAKRWTGVENALEDRIVELTEDVAKRKEQGEIISEARMYRLQRYQRLVGQVQQEFGKYADWSEKDLSSYQRNSGVLGIDHAREAIQLTGVGVAFDRLPYEAVENMVGVARNGQPLGELLKLRMVKDARGQPLPGVFERLTSSLINGTALGRNPRDVAKDMRDDLSGGLAKALLIARTEGLRPYKEMSRAQYEASGVVSGHRRLSAHDGRVCGACLADEGTLYRVQDTVSDHPNGRCTSVPVVKGMPEVEWLKGEDWLSAQPEGVQRSVLGGVRFEAWSQGLFNFKDLVRRSYSTTWGASISSASLRDLVPVRAAQAIIGAPIPPELIPKGWVTREEAASRLGINTTAVSMLLSKGELEGMIVKVGNQSRRLISEASIAAYLAKKGVKPPPPPDKNWMTVSEAAAYSNLSTTRIRALVKKGELVSDTQKRGTRMVMVIDQVSLDAYLAGKGVPTTVPKGYATIEVIADSIGAGAYVLDFVSELRDVVRTAGLKSIEIAPPGAPVHVYVYSIAAVTAVWKAYEASTGIVPKIPKGYATIDVISEHLNVARDLLLELALNSGIQPIEVVLPGMTETLPVFQEAEVVAAYEAYAATLPPKGFFSLLWLSRELRVSIEDLETIAVKYGVSRATRQGEDYFNAVQMEAAISQWKATITAVGWVTFPEAVAQVGLPPFDVRLLIGKNELEARNRPSPETGKMVLMVSQASINAYLAKQDVEGWFTEPEAGRYLGVNTDTIKTLADLGRIEGKLRINPKTGRKAFMISQRSLDAYKAQKGKEVAAAIPTGYESLEAISTASHIPLTELLEVVQKYGVSPIKVETKDKIVMVYLVAEVQSAVQKQKEEEAAKAEALARPLKERLEEAAEVRGRMLEEHPRIPLTIERDEIIRDYLEVPVEQRTELTVNWTGRRKMPQKYQEGLDQYGRLVSRRGTLGATRSVTVSVTYDGRAFHDYANGVYLTPFTDVNTVVHELGHELEYSDPIVHKEALKFLRRRTKGEKFEWLGDNYDTDERTKKDKFLHPYMGKDYEGKATEIVSMGLEHFITDPVKLAKVDPDMFDFIYAIVRE